MTCHRSLPGLGKRLTVIRPSNLGSESRGNLLRFPAGLHFEAVISGLGDRQAIANRTAYRKRLLGIVVLCSTLLLISGVAAIMIGWNVNLTRLSTVSVEATAVSPNTN
jgi:hypothetical protein